MGVLGESLGGPATTGGPAGPAGPTGPPGPVVTLTLTYNSSAPTSCEVVDGLAYSTAAGGTVFIIVPAAISPNAADTPGIALVNTTGVITDLILFEAGNPGVIAAYDGAANLIPLS